MLSLPARAVIKRELLSGLRNPRPFIFLALFMVFMILGLFFLLDVVYANQLNGRGMAGSMVRELFMELSMGLYFCGVLLVPPMAAVSICVEKQQDSYDLLRMTYISPTSLALAKLCNVMGIYLLVIIATLPFVGLFFFLVGIDTTQFAITFSLVILSSLSLAVLGIMCSAWFYRTLPAIICTYLLGAMAHGGVLFVLVAYVEFVDSSNWLSLVLEQFTMPIMGSAAPYIGIVMSSQGMVGTNVIHFALVYNGLIVIAGLLAARAILQRPARPILVNNEVLIDDQAELKARRKKFPYYLLDPRRRRPMIPDTQNPVYAKELQTGLLSRGAFAARVLYGFTILSFMISIFAIGESELGQDPQEMAGYTFFINTILILIAMPALVATSLAKEWEWQNVDSLQCTLLESNTILWGKFYAAVRLALLPVAGAVLGAFLIPFFGYDSFEFWKATFMSLIGMTTCVFYALAVSFCVTVNQRKSLSALLTAYGAAGFALGLAPVAALLLAASVVDNHYISDSDLAYYFLFSPIYAYSAALQGTGMLRDGNYVLYGLTSCGLSTGMGVLLLLFARNRFARLFWQDRS